MILSMLNPAIKKRLYFFISDSKGLTLIEVLVALAILGIVAGIFLTGLSVSSKSVMVSEKRITAESLAKSQVEYIKNLDYDDINNPPVYAIDPDLNIPAGYDISVTAERLDPENDGLGDDDGLQKVTITVSRDDNTVFVLTDYKTNY